MGIFKKERLIYNIRKHQDLNWIEMNITEEFGKMGKERIKDFLQYKGNPFKTLKDLKSLINGNTNS